MRFVQFPKVLFAPKFSKLSNDAKVLYSLLLDRMQLSIKNKWEDAVGIFIFFSQAEMAASLNCSLPTVRKRITELLNSGLIFTIRIGLGKPNRIYVLEPCLTNEEDEWPIRDRQYDFLQERKQGSHQEGNTACHQEGNTACHLDGKNASANETEPTKPNPTPKPNPNQPNPAPKPPAWLALNPLLSILDILEPDEAYFEPLAEITAAPCVV